MVVWQNCFTDVLRASLGAVGHTWCQRRGWHGGLCSSSGETLSEPVRAFLRLGVRAGHDTRLKVSKQIRDTLLNKYLSWGWFVERCGWEMRHQRFLSGSEQRWDASSYTSVKPACVTMLHSPTEPAIVLSHSPAEFLLIFLQILLKSEPLLMATGAHWRWAVRLLRHEIGYCWLNSL